MKVGGRGIDLRVATLPTVYGEKVVMRILDKGQAVLQPRGAGLPARDATTRFETSYRKPYGTILVTGPTGSGKSTTLYATLNMLNKPDRNIITVEDPVEYRLPGHQPGADQPEGRAHVRRRRCGRSCVPTPTSCSSVRSATGRPRSSASRPRSPVTSCSRRCTPTTPRRRRCGSSRWVSSRSSSRSALDCVVAQRLARRLCDKCKEPYQPTEAELLEAGWPMRGARRRRSGRRCTGRSAAPSCGRTGYRGRFALHEVMLVTEEIERLIIERRSTEDLQKVAVMQGMLTAAAPTACARSAWA